MAIMKLFIFIVPPNGWPIFEEEKIYWTWVLFIAFVIPELFTFLRSLRFCIFKGQNKPSWLQFAVPFVAEVIKIMLFSLGIISNLLYACLIPYSIY